jgi:MFS transporter, YNFM family, putative membrane transport protein
MVSVDIQRKKSRLSIVAVALAGFSAFLHLYATQSLLPLLRQVFHASRVEVSLTVSATTIAVALAAPVIGLLADSLGRKRIIVFAAFGLTIPTFLAATASGLYELVGWRFAQGLFMPAIFAVTVAYISEEWDRDRVGSVMAAYITGNILGGVLGRFLSGVIAAQWGWRGSFLVLGCLNFLSGAAIWAWLPNSQSFQRELKISALTANVMLHLRNPKLWAAYAVGFNVLFSNVSTFTYVNFYLAAPPFRLGTAALGSVFFVYLLGALVTPIVGRWMGRVGYRVTLAIAILTASSGVCMTLNPTLWVIILGLAISAAGIFVCQSAANSYIGMVSGQGKATAAGLYIAFYYLGGSIGAIAPGFAWSAGGWPACVAMIISIQFLTAGLALRFWRS